jgi:magnesium-transporting ATPase (P-type)
MGTLSLEQSQQGRHLIDGRVLTRVFGVLGPAESLMEVLAFFVALLAAGWVPEHPFLNGHDLAAASGTAFATVIFCQIGVAFACRSATKWPGDLGWLSNRLLLLGVGLAIALMAAFEFIGPVAAALGQAPPPPVGWLVALSGVVVMLGVDAGHKRLRGRRRETEQQATRARLSVLPSFNRCGVGGASPF